MVPREYFTRKQSRLTFAFFLLLTLFLARGLVQSSAPDKKTLHKEVVSATKCSECHSQPAYTADFSKSRHSRKDVDCLTCHRFDDEGLPLTVNCSSCHVRPQGDSKDVGTDEQKQSNRSKRLPRMSGEWDCFSCHSVAELKRPPKNLLHPLAPYELLHPSSTQDTGLQGSQCLLCHSPHSSKYSNLLKSAELDLCFSCHESVKREIHALSSHRIFSGSVRCSDCHKAHRINELPMRYHPVNRISREFLVNRSPQTDNKMCLTCHNYLALTTGEASGFRTPGLNLHRLHVEKGFAVCLDCHSPHGSVRPALMREKIAGEHLTFVQSTQGGTCTILCHGLPHNPATYLRSD